VTGSISGMPCGMSCEMERKRREKGKKGCITFVITMQYYINISTFSTIWLIA
jgi:hypothetical protein